jgi:hypothetical protein
VDARPSRADDPALLPDRGDRQVINGMRKGTHQAMGPFCEACRRQFGQRDGLLLV